MASPLTRPLALVGLLALLAPHLGAQSIADQTGLSALIERLGPGNQPTGSGVIVGMTEAGGSSFLPDFNHPEFVGKLFNPHGPGSGTSGHATTVGQYYFGLSTSIAPGIPQIECYEATNWMGGGFLNGSGSTPPDIGVFKVLNHSWIGSGFNPLMTLRKLDFAIDDQGYVVCVGVNNGTGPLDQPLLSHGFNLLAVGRSDGSHKAGPTGLGMDGIGRQKPEIVAPAGATSYSTPLVSGAAALLVETARVHPALASNPAAERPEVIKAALLAGAEHRSGWSNNAPASGPQRGATVTPLDDLWGADEVDVNRSHWILTGGEVDGALSVPAALPAAPAAWDQVSLGSGQSRYWRFEVSNSAPHVSALLTWHRRFPTSFSSYEMPDLDLELWRLDGQGQLQSLVGDAGLAYFSAGNVLSESSVDNLEHLYLEDLAPGSYVLEARRKPDAFGVWRAALAWDLACREPLAYGTGKLNSIGLVPSLGWGGFPSRAAGEFELRVTGAVPGNLGLVFWGVGQASLPLLGGTLLVAPPLKRMAPVALDAAGAVAVPLPIEADMPGLTRNYQFWYRDPTHVDGTGSGLSSAVEVTFCE